MKIHYFQRYHEKENVATANTMLLLSRLYSYSSDKFFRFLKSEYFSDSFNPEIIFTLQERSVDSIPDARRYFGSWNKNVCSKNGNAASRSDYDTVKRIRNNAHVCLYYLLGGFYFLDTSLSGIELIGIIDYRFESLYQLIRQKRIRWFDTKFHDGSQCVVYYLNDDEGIEYSEAGELKKARLHFLRTEMSKEDAYIAEVNELMKDIDFMSKHSFYVSHDSMPLEMKPIMLKKKRQ